MPKTVKEHQKQVVRGASIAGGTLKTILNAPQKRAKKEERIAMAVIAVASDE